MAFFSTYGGGNEQNYVKEAFETNWLSLLTSM